MADVETRVPPTGEEIHLPEPSLLPLAMAAAITLALVGLTISLAITAVGTVAFVLVLVRWVRETRRDIDELPLEHDAH